MVLGPGAASQLPGGAVRPGLLVHHQTMVEGLRPGPRNITLHGRHHAASAGSPLSEDEITSARKMVFDSGLAVIPAEDLRFAYVGLCDPPKDLVRAFDRGEAVVVDRRVRMVVLQGPEANVFEVIVSVTRGVVDPGSRCTTSGRPCRWKRPSWCWRRCMTTRTGWPRWSVGASPIAPWCRSTRGRPGHSARTRRQDRRITRCLAYLRTAPG